MATISISYFIRISTIKAFIALTALVLLNTACQGAMTSTPRVIKNAPTDTQTPKTTRIVSPKPPAATLTPAIALVENVSLSPEELRGAEVSLWHIWSGELGEAFERLVADFNAANEFGVAVQTAYQGNYNELYEKVDAAIASGELPEIALGYNYELLSWNAAGDILVDLNAYVEDANWGFNPQEIDDFFPTFWQQDEVDRVRLGVPAQRFGQLIYYNISWARELGFEDPPQTARQFKQQACAAAQANRTNDDPEDDGTGGWAVNITPSAVLSWLYAFDSQVVNSRGKDYQFNTPQTEDALAYLKDLHDSGCTWEIDGDHAEEEFAARQALFITASIADLPKQRAAFEQRGKDDEWTVIPFPSPTSQPIVAVYGPAFAVFKSSERDQLAAWVFLKWFLSPENQARWVSTGYTFPVRAATLDHLDEFTREHPQWAQAVELLPLAKSEPRLQSWSVVRWTLSDVGTQMFRPYFTADRIPATVELLDETASELHMRLTP